MALEDVAKLVAPKRPGQALKLLNCFYGGKGKTFDELLKETGFGEKLLRYYITRLRYFRLIDYSRSTKKYVLDYGAFHARIDTLLCDPIKGLLKP